MTDCNGKINIWKVRLQREYGYLKRQIAKGRLIFEKTDCKGKIRSNFPEKKLAFESNPCLNINEDSIHPLGSPVRYNLTKVYYQYQNIT